MLERFTFGVVGYVEQRLQLAPLGCGKVFERNVFAKLDPKQIRFGMEGEQYYLAMEFVEGFNLHQYIQQKGKLDPEEAREHPLSLRMVGFGLVILSSAALESIRLWKLPATLPRSPLSRGPLSRALTRLSPIMRATMSSPRCAGASSSPWRPASASPPAKSCSPQARRRNLTRVFRTGSGTADVSRLRC